MGAIRLSVRYATGLTYAQITAAAAVTLVVLALSRNTVGDARQLLTQANLVALVALMAGAPRACVSVGRHTGGEPDFAHAQLARACAKGWHVPAC